MKTLYCHKTVYNDDKQISFKKGNIYHYEADGYSNIYYLRCEFGTRFQFHGTFYKYFIETKDVRKLRIKWLLKN